MCQDSRVDSWSSCIILGDKKRPGYTWIVDPSLQKWRIQCWCCTAIATATLVDNVVMRWLICSVATSDDPQPPSTDIHRASLERLEVGRWRWWNRDGWSLQPLGICHLMPLGQPALTALTTLGCRTAELSAESSARRRGPGNWHETSWETKRRCN